MMSDTAGRAVSGRIDRHQTVFMTTYRRSSRASYGLSFQSVTSMYEDRDGIWIGTGWGQARFRFDPQKRLFRKYPQTAG